MAAPVPPSERFRFYRRDLRHPGEMTRRWLGLPSRRRAKVSTSLRFLHEVLGFERFHYGLWEPHEELTLANAKVAQQRYSERFLDWVPPEVESILDVGCGIGLDALELTRRGYRVEGLSPDPYQQQHFVERTGLPFHLDRFQDFDAQRTYDLVLMSESAQYVGPNKLLAQVASIAPGGWLLLSDYFTLASSPSQLDTSGHDLDAFRRTAEDAGFRLERELDVTEQTAPSLDLHHLWWQRYIEPSLGIAAGSLRFRFPRLFRLGRRLLEPTLEKHLARGRELTGEEFRRTKRYIFMLWRVPGGRPASPQPS